MTLTRRMLLTLGSAFALSGPAMAAPVTALYQGRTIVTGRRPETTIPGMVRCLAQALVRVSGDPRLPDHPDFARFARSPEAAVKTYSYRDLYAFRPIRDEQGTRDRPYEMTVEYVPEKIDAMLRQLGSTPWLAERPRLVVFLAVRHISSRFILTSLVDAGELMRESFKDAAWNAALEVVIPSDRTIAQAGLTVETLPATPIATLMPLVDRSVGQIPLVGELTWDKTLLGWTDRWRIALAGTDHAFEQRGVNFDAAFRFGVGTAAQFLSGNGPGSK